MELTVAEQTPGSVLSGREDEPGRTETLPHPAIACHAMSSYSAPASTAKRRNTTGCMAILSDGLMALVGRRARA